MAAGAYSIAAPSSLGFEASADPAAPRSRPEAVSRAPAPTRVAALATADAARALPLPQTTFDATPAPIESSRVPGLAMFMAAALWIFVLVRRRWPDRG